MRTFFQATVLAAGLVAGLAMALPAIAQERVVPRAEFFFDADSGTTRPITAERGSGDAVVERLGKTIARNPRNVEAAAHLAHIAMEGGRPELGRELYERASRLVSPSHRLYRPLLWNQGWDLFRAGDADGALAKWQVLLADRAVNATWMPPTFALAMWTVGRHDEAVHWYAAAVRSEPALWTTADRHAGLLPDWRPAELEVLGLVQQAWERDPPQWP